MESETEHLSVEEIRALIREKKDEIKKEFRAEIVGIFGSYARGEEKEKSDIDVLVRFGEGATLLHLTGLGLTHLKYRKLDFINNIIIRY